MRGQPGSGHRSPQGQGTRGHRPAWGLWGGPRLHPMVGGTPTALLSQRPGSGCSWGCNLARGRGYQAGLAMDCPQAPPAPWVPAGSPLVSVKPSRLAFLGYGADKLLCEPRPRGTSSSHQSQHTDGTAPSGSCVAQGTGDEALPPSWVPCCAHTPQRDWGTLVLHHTCPSVPAVPREQRVLPG